jgi:hypothetical protein
MQSSLWCPHDLIYFFPPMESAGRPASELAVAETFTFSFFWLLRFFFAIFTFGHSMSFYNAAVRYHNGMSDCGCSQIVHLATTFSTGSTEHDIRMQGVELAPKIF